MLTVHRRMLSDLRDYLHPLDRIKRTTLGERVLRMIDRPAWIKLAGVPNDRVRLKMFSHAAYYLTLNGPEPELTATFAKLVRSRSIHTFVDVGSNIGSYTWTFLSLVPTGQVIAVEPDPASVRLFRETARRWRRPVELHAVALSKEEGRAKLFIDHTGGHRSSLVTGKKDEMVAVRTRRLDDVVGNRRVDLVKIDVEGAEREVLTGAQGTLRRDRPCFIIECFHRPPNCLEPLRRLDYEILDGERGGVAQEKTTNYLALPPKARS